MVKLLLTDLLKKRQKSIYWLSKRTGIRYATLHSWTKETPQQIGTDSLEKICKALECTPADLIVIRRRKLTSKQPRES